MIRNPFLTSVFNQTFSRSLQTTPLLSDWMRPHISNHYLNPRSLWVTKRKRGRTAWKKTPLGKRLQIVMKERNLMESDPWVQHQLHLKYGHIPPHKRI